VTAVSASRLHPRAAPLLCAACLIPFRKKYGGMRPIAVGDTLRRLVAKWLLATSQGRSATAALAPLQTAFEEGSPCEVVAMGVQSHVDALTGSTGLLLLQVYLKTLSTPSIGRPSWAPWDSGARQCSRGSGKRPWRHPCWWAGRSSGRPGSTVGRPPGPLHLRGGHPGGLGHPPPRRGTTHVVPG